MKVRLGNNSCAWQGEADFAVFFWERASEHVSWTEHMHELSECDVVDAIRWAEDTRAGRPWALAAIANDRTESPGDERGFLWLLGRDLNTGPTNDQERATERLMFERRGRTLLAPDVTD